MSEQLIAEKLNELNSITDMETGRPTIPVSIALQEASDLVDWCSKDKNALVRAGLDWRLVEDIPARSGALRISQSKWTSEYKAYQDCQAEWKIAAPKAYKLRDELIHHFFYALNNIPSEYSKVKRINEGSSHADMIQDLMDLYELGQKHIAILEAIGFDLSLLDEARTRSFELAELLAKVNGANREISPKIKIRDLAYTHLKEAVDEIRRVGQYVFWKDQNKLKGYTSNYLKRTRGKSKVKVEIAETL